MITLAAGNTIAGVSSISGTVTYTFMGMELNAGTEVYKVLAQGQLPQTIPAVLYTVPASTTTFVKLITMCNTAGTSTAGNILYVNGTAATNQIMSSLTMVQASTLTIDDTGMKLYDSSGNLALSGIIFNDTTLPGTTTPLALSAPGASPFSARRDHQHQSPGGIASISSSVAIANTETVVVGATLPANLMLQGTTFRVTAAGVGTTTSATAGTFRIRIGTTTLTGNIATTASATTITTVTAQPFYLEGLVSLRSNGSGGTVIGEMQVYSTNVSTGLFTVLNILSTTTATVAVDTTAQKLIELTYISGASTVTLTFHVAAIEIVKM